MSFPGEGALSSLIAGGLNYVGAREANRANKKMAREQMQFQEHMSNTSYQRAVADLEAAGLNPMLAYMNGGASSPQGSSAQMINEMSGSFSSAMDARRASAEVKNLKEQNSKLKAETELTKELRRVAEMDKAVKANTAKSIMYDLGGKQVENAIDKGPYGLFLRMLQRVMPFGNLMRSK